MNICAYFCEQGFIIAELLQETETSINIKNPVALNYKNNSLGMSPLFHFLEEKEVVVLLSDIYYHKVFTPIVEIANEYRKLFGSGLVVSNVLPL